LGAVRCAEISTNSSTKIGAREKAPTDDKGEPDGILYKLEQEDGTPPARPSFTRPYQTWNAGDTIPLAEGRLGRSPDDEPVLVVDPT